MKTNEEKLTFCKKLFKDYRPRTAIALKSENIVMRYLDGSLTKTAKEYTFKQIFESLFDQEVENIFEILIFSYLTSFNKDILYVNLEFNLVKRGKLSFTDEYFMPIKNKNQKILILKKIQNAKNIIIFKVSVVSDYVGHAINFIYKKQGKQMNFFDPHGSDSDIFDLFDSIKSQFKKLTTLDGVNFLHVKKFRNFNLSCPREGLQYNEANFLNNERDLYGYCLFHSAMMMELVVLNPTKNIYFIQEEYLKYLKKNNIKSIEYIREYFLYLHNLLYKILYEVEKYVKDFNRFTLSEYLKNQPLMEKIWKHPEKLNESDFNIYNYTIIMIKKKLFVLFKINVKVSLSKYSINENFRKLFHYKNLYDIEGFSRAIFLENFFQLDKTVTLEMFKEMYDFKG